MNEPKKIKFFQGGGSVFKVTVQEVILTDDFTAPLPSDGICGIRINPDDSPRYFLVRNHSVCEVITSLEEAIEVFCLKD